MHRTIKRLLKHSRLFRIIFLMCIILIVAAFIFRSNYTIKDSEIEQLNSMESCLVKMGMPQTYSECLNKLSLTGEDLDASVKNILRLSKNHKLLGYAYLVQEEHELAQKELNDALLDNASDMEARKALVFVEMKLEDYYGVIEHCRFILQEDPNNTLCLDAQGIAYYIADENEKAVNNAKLSFELEPSFCHEFNLALFQGGIGDIEETKATIDKLLAEDKTKILKCWSPIKQDISDDKLDNFDLCFLNKQKQESVCRNFAKEGWKTKLQGVEMPEPVFSM